MLKKIVVIVGLFLIVGFSVTLMLKSEHATVQNSEKQAKNEEVLDLNKIYTFSRESLPISCTVKNAQLCAVEGAVKCTINPDFEGCKTFNLPKFIFMQDSQLDRPTEISYRIANKKVLINDTVEIYTDSACNGGWFGLCQGTVIYVLAKEDGKKWYVKDIYAIE